MNVTFVLPAVGKRDAEPYIRSWKMEPLTIAYLSALTPPAVTRRFYDDRVELIDFSVKTDLVAVSVETYTSRRAYEIAGRFRSRGIRVVLGGYHPTLNPDEAKAHADAVIVGEAEPVWAEVLSDAEAGTLKPFYGSRKETRTGGTGPETGCNDTFRWVAPDRSVYAKNALRYTPLTLIETSRGCSHSCGFCSVSAFHGGTYRMRPVENVIAEIRATGKKYFFIIDDNFFGNPARAKELLRALIPLRIKWSGQGTLTAARDPEMMELLRASGCIMMLIGFESLDEENLEEMNKSWMASLGERDELVEKFHEKGISIYATFVFGYAHDDERSFRRALDFSLEHRFFFAAFNHLLPWPGTPLYETLRRRERLVTGAWWLEEGYRYGDYPFVPENMSREELTRLCTASRKEFFSLSNILKRGAALLGRTGSPLLHAVYYSQNLLLREEVDRKLEIPIGKGLDALPK